MSGNDTYYSITDLLEIEKSGCRRFDACKTKRAIEMRIDASFSASKLMAPQVLTVSKTARAYRKSGAV